jgi:hypothetical protein
LLLSLSLRRCCDRCAGLHDARQWSRRVATVMGMGMVVRAGVIDVVGRKNNGFPRWGVNMVTWCRSFNGLQQIPDLNFLKFFNSTPSTSKHIHFLTGTQHPLITRASPSAPPPQMSCLGSRHMAALCSHRQIHDTVSALLFSRPTNLQPLQLRLSSAFLLRRTQVNHRNRPLSPLILPPLPLSTQPLPPSNPCSPVQVAEPAHISTVSPLKTAMLSPLAAHRLPRLSHVHG